MSAVPKIHAEHFADMESVAPANGNSRSNGSGAPQDDGPGPDEYGFDGEHDGHGKGGDAGDDTSKTAPGGTAKAWPTLNAAAIFAPLEPVNYLLAALDICPGAPTLVAGYGFTAKTLTLQSAAVSIAAGLPVWGTFPSRKGKVAHVDYEQGPWLTRSRYQRLAAGLMVTPQELEGQLELVSLPQVYLDGAGLESFFTERFAGFDLVIVDSLRAACPSLEENDSAVRCVLDMLNRVSCSTGACVVVIHHCRKPQRDAAGGAKMAIRGSGAIFDACGSVLVLEAEKGEPTRVAHEKARTSGRCADDFLLRISDVDADGVARGGLVVSCEASPAGAAATGADSALDIRVLDAVQRHPGASGRQLWSTLPGTRRENVLNSLARLEMTERVRGKEGKGRAMTWWPVEESKNG